MIITLMGYRESPNFKEPEFLIKSSDKDKEFFNLFLINRNQLGASENEFFKTILNDSIEKTISDCLFSQINSFLQLNLISLPCVELVSYQ